MPYFMGRGWMMRNLALISLIVIAAIGWLRPSPDRVTDHYFIDQNNQIVQYKKPSWVTGEAIRYGYEGKGIYRIEFNSGWIVRVNRLGVVWRADHEPPTGFQFGTTVVMPAIALAVLLIGGVIGRAVWASHQRAKEIQDHSDRIWETIKNAERKAASSMGDDLVIDVEPDASGVFR